jgi:hypothetical protein
MASNESAIMAIIRHPFVETFTWFYMTLQAVLTWIFAPIPPPPTAQNENIPRKRVAVIGAGVTGVSSAAHCVGHGFDVQLFESRTKEQGLGGIWSVSCLPFKIQLHKTLANLFSESQFYLRIASPQSHVPFPSFG